MNTKQLALIKKDIRSVTANKRVLTALLLVPIVLTIVLPSVFVIGTLTAPEMIADFQVLLDMLPGTVEGNEQQLVLLLLLNKIMPVFFLMIPIMSSSVMAASSFVGEKEKRTLETLLYSPLSLKQLFQAKILAGLFVGMAVSCISFAVMLLVVEAEVIFLTGGGILPDASWLVVMLLIAPAISLAGIAIIVRGSAKAQCIEEAQQRAVFLVFPVLALIIGQFGGILLVNVRLLLAFGIALVAADVLLMRGAAGRFTYEQLLKQV